MRFSLAIIAILPGSVVLAAPPEADREWQAIQTCQFAVMASLHDPKSAEFPGISRSYRKLVGGVYTTQVEVRAKNAYNATRLAVFECKIDAKTMGLKSIKQLRN